MKNIYAPGQPNPWFISHDNGTNIYVGGPLSKGVILGVRDDFKVEFFPDETAAMNRARTLRPDLTDKQLKGDFTPDAEA